MKFQTSKEKFLPKPGPSLLLDAFKLVIDSASEYASVIAKEKTQRGEIHAWAETQLEILHIQRDFYLAALDKTFDERTENFRNLFDKLDQALTSESEGSGAVVAELLGAITDLAKSSPFKDLKSPELVVREFLRGGRIVEL